MMIYPYLKVGRIVNYYGRMSNSQFKYKENRSKSNIVIYSYSHIIVNFNKEGEKMISREVLKGDEVYFLTDEERLGLIKSKDEFEVIVQNSKTEINKKVKQETLLNINPELQLTGEYARSEGYPVAFYLGEVCYFLKCEVIM